MKLDFSTVLYLQVSEVLLWQGTCIVTWAQVDGYNEVQGGYRFRERNVDGKRVLA